MMNRISKKGVNTIRNLATNQAALAPSCAYIRNFKMAVFEIAKDYSRAFSTDSSWLDMTKKQAWAFCCWMQETGDQRTDDATIERFMKYLRGLVLDKMQQYLKDVEIIDKV